MKWFLERNRRTDESKIGATGLRIALGAMILGAVALSASASLIVWQSPGLMMDAGNGLTRWLENAEAGSGVEKALYRLMKLPYGEALYRRSPREARPELTNLINNSQKNAALYSLRAMEDEKALDFEAAERDWKTWAEKSEDKAGANLDLADFYERRLKPKEELAALEAVGQAEASPRERWTATESQQAWKAWEKTLTVVDRYALGRAVAAREYAGWERRYPQETGVYERQLAFDLEGKDYAGATVLIARYQKAFPNEALFPVRAEADVAAGRGTAKDGLAVYDRNFEPLWPAELVKDYYALLEKGHQTLKVRDALRARLAANPQGGADALKDAARLFYIFQQQGQPETAKAVLAGYRERKDARAAAWSADELYTLGRLLEQMQDFTEAARYYYALAAKTQAADANEKGLAGLVRILLTAPEQPLRLGAGNLALYQSIATMDRGPGYLNGILSLFFNTQQPASEYSSEDQLAVPYFHRAKAAELLAEFDKRFPQSAERAELHFQLMTAYMAYAEDNSVIREGTLFLAAFPADSRRVEVALELGDVYSRTEQSEKEFALYKDLLKELAAKADGVPLGTSGGVYSKPVGGQSTGTARSTDYARVLDRYLSRLVVRRRLPDALEVLRGELDHNPQDPGLYEKLANFLEQNRMNAHEEEVYQRAIAQFQESGHGATGWYAKLARFYLRQRRKVDYMVMTRMVTGIFSGTDLEAYLSQAPAPDAALAIVVNRYAHECFPHDLTFVRSLLAEYSSYANPQPAEAEKLLWEHWSESADLRDRLFELLSSTGRLDAQLAALRQQAPEIDKADWTGLAKTNPAAERFWMESCLWQSRFEEGAAPAEALAAEFPADAELGNTASSLYRSLAYFYPEDTNKAVAIEKRLLSAWPDDIERMARIGDIYADRGRMAEAAPYWTRMAEVHPGEADGYLQSATVYWDYFDFASASAQLRKARERLAQPALYGYQAGAIEESQNNIPGAIQEYAASSLGDKPSEESRERLLALARRPEWRAAIETETGELLKQAAPSSTAIELRISVLDAQQRADDRLRELKQVVAQTESFDVLDAVTAAARSHALPEVEQLALSRQIALTADPVRSLELRYQLVELLQQQHNPAAAAAEVDAIYREHAKVLGVVRSTVDYDWAHERKPQAVTVLLASADAAYPELKQQFQLEAARKLTDLGEYPRSKKLLEPLLSQKPLDATIEAALADNYARSGDQAGLEAFYRAELAGVKAAAMERGEKMQRLAQLRRGIINAASLMGNWDSATDQYLELINAYPDDEGLAQEAALVAGAHGLRAKLVNFYNKTVEASPQDARWSIVLARLQTALEDYPAAIEAYGKAIRVRPEQKDLYVSKADLEERLHRLDDAVADYDALYKLSYHDPQWKVKIAEARARQGRNADAVKALDDAWIAGRAPRASNYDAVATRLEQWGMLDEARSYAEHCVEIAGAELLADPVDHSCAVDYARVMARLRQSDAAFTRLAIARQQAENVSLSMVSQQVARQGFGAITDDEWRKQRVAERTGQAKSGFAQALRAMAAVVAEYATPEEKAQFAAWLQPKRATAADISELREVYLPAIQVAGLLDMEADLLWELAVKRSDDNRGNVSEWLQLERKRVQLDGVGAKLEKLAAEIPYQMRSTMWQQAADVDRALGDSAAELRNLDRIAATPNGAVVLSRYYELLLAQRPQNLVQRAGNDYVALFLLAHGKPELALAGIDERSYGMPAVWKKAYTGLTGFYLRQHTPQIRSAFAGALGGDATIGERVSHPANRDEQLAGEVWFYYGARYGEYLDAEKDAQAEGYLESELEHTPERANAYVQLADYSAEVGRADYALADYQHSLELKSDQPGVLNSIANLEWKQGRQADALAAWQLAVKQLAVELDNRMPQSFWGDFAQVVGDVAKNGQYAIISQQIDAMLRIYLKRNGEYQVEELLKAGYHARGDSMDWLLEITMAAHDPSSVLNTISIRQNSWIARSQVSQLLQRRVELERRKAQAKPGEASYELDNAESSLVNELLTEKKYAEARAELQRIPEEKRITLQWLGVTLRLAEADGSLAQMVAQWKKNSAAAPTANDLQNAVQALSEPSKRMVMRFVYERALDARELTASNFLGLAAINLDEGNVPGAVALLKRLTLISGNPYGDANSAASLLETKHKFAEAIQFLQPLAQASPWDASLKIRLAVATLAVNANEQQALTALMAVAADPKAKYAERVAAAKALKGHGAASAELGSAELNLLMRDGCPSADDAGKPFFVQARMAAAACAVDKNAKERLLHAALADAPDNTELRFQYVSAAFVAGQDAQALVAAEPILQYGSFYGQRSMPVYGSSEDEEDAGIQRVPATSTVKPEDANKLTWYAIHAREKRHESDEALELLARAVSEETDPARRHALQDEQNRLQTDAAREAENSTRAPNIRKDLDQKNVVRPRLLPGEPFTPRKAANGEEEVE